MRRIATVWAAALLGLTAAPALGQDLELTLTPKAEQVAVGDRIQATLTLTNKGEQALELTELTEDRMVVSWDVQLDGGRTFVYERIHPSPLNPRLDWPKASLAAGASWTLEVGFPAVAVGKLTIVAHYSRPARPVPDVGDRPGGNFPAPPAPQSPHVQATPVTIEVTPTAAGEDELELRLVTGMGPIRARLFPKDALGTCMHFVERLQTGDPIRGKQRRHFYDGLTFHRVGRGFMIQGGCPNGDGTGDAGYSIPIELPPAGEIPDHLRHKPGRLAMARSGHPDSAGTQFFVCVGTPTWLDGQYTCFGEVTRGLDVAYSISEVDTMDAPGSRERDRPVTPVTINSIRAIPVKRAAGGGQ